MQAEAMTLEQRLAKWEGEQRGPSQAAAVEDYAPIGAGSAGLSSYGAALDRGEPTTPPTPPVGDTKHPYESYTEFYARRGLGLTYEQGAYRRRILEARAKAEQAEWVKAEQAKAEQAKAEQAKAEQADREMRTKAEADPAQGLSHGLSGLSFYPEFGLSGSFGLSDEEDSLAFGGLGIWLGEGEADEKEGAEYENPVPVRFRGLHVLICLLVGFFLLVFGSILTVFVVLYFS